MEWNLNSPYQFEKGGEKIFLMDYYKTHYIIDIKDQQPLLVHRGKEK